jgi:hypothetical protein
VNKRQRLYDNEKKEERKYAAAAATTTATTATATATANKTELSSRMECDRETGYQSLLDFVKGHPDNLKGRACKNCKKK